jgi:hypothetical protein
MNVQRLMMPTVTAAILAAGSTNAATVMLGDEVFSARSSQTLGWPTKHDARLSLRLQDGVAGASQDDETSDVVWSGAEASSSIDLLSSTPEATASGAFNDLLASGSSSSSDSTPSGGVPLASTSGGSKGMPSTSETESSGSSWPGTDSTQDGQNLSSGERTGSSGASGTDLPPAQSVPGSGVAAVALMGLASASRRRR